MVSVIIPMRNEENFIGACLDSIIANDYPKEYLEVIVLDGMSSDRSREIVLDYSARYPYIRLLDNPGRIAPTALNIGIREARGEIIIRMDAHAVYAPDYISNCVELLQTSGAANVGGLQRAIGNNYISNAIALATTSRFGIGDAKYRYAEKEMWVDTVYLGAWYKKTLEAIGGFNEKWVVNQDYELNYRLRAAGKKILLSPKIRCWYFVRDSLRKLARQYFRYGMWKVKTLVAHPDSLRWRQMAPPLLVTALLLSMILLVSGQKIGLFIPLIYFIASLVASVVLAFKRGLRYLPILPIVFWTLHLSWGTGFFAGLVRFGIPKISLTILARAFKGEHVIN